MQLAGRSRLHKQGFGLMGLLVLVVILGLLLGIFSLVRALIGHTLLSNGCRDTNITLQPISLNDLKASLIVQAKLTMGTQPVAHEQVTFRTIGHDNHGRALGDLIGQATTDANGVAMYKNTAGVADQSITYGVGGVITGVEAEFDGNSLMDRNNNPSVPFYCGSKATTNLVQPFVIQKVEI